MITLALTGFAVLGFTKSSGAQDDAFRLNVNRSYGYSSGSQIRGLFKVSLIGTGDIRKTTFSIDRTVLAVVEKEPFEVSFQTRDYPAGWHTLQAVAETSDGVLHQTAERKFEFVSAEVESAAVQRILLPLFGGVFLFILVIIAIQVIIVGKSPTRKIPPGTRRRYGFKGGAVCPRCGRPFSLHWWSFNLVVKVYDRCDFCGGWSVVKPTRPDVLRKAEDAELEQTEDSSESIQLKQDEAEAELRKKIEDSRFFQE